MRLNLFFLILLTGFCISTPLLAQTVPLSTGILDPLKVLEDEFPMDKVTKIKGFKTPLSQQLLNSLDVCYEASFTNQQLEKAKAYSHYYTKDNPQLLSVIKGLQKIYEEEIEKGLGKKGLPNCLKYLPMAMAANNRRYVSPTGRVGLWQLTYPVAIKYGLTVTEDIDERRDVARATEAAAAYLKDLYNLFKSHDMALMAFTCGPAAVNKAVIRTDDKRDYASLYNYLPIESRDYILDYTVLLYLSEYEGKEKIPPFEIIQGDVSEAVELKNRLAMRLVAKELRLEVQAMKAMNPVYRSNYFPVSKKYPLQLPKGYKTKFEAKEDTLYKMQEAMDKPKPKPVPEPPKPRPTPTAAIPSGSEKLVYTVKPGDNLSYISQWYHVRVSDLKGWNKLRSDRIDVGQKLTVYVPKAKVSQYKKIDSMSQEEKLTLIGKGPKQEVKPASKTEGGEWIMYTVKSGDTLWSISRKYNCSTADIMKWNGIGENIDVGQVIKIKKS